MASEVPAGDTFRDGSPKGLSPRVIYEASHEGEVIGVVMIHSDIVVSARWLCSRAISDSELTSLLLR